MLGMPSFESAVKSAGWGTYHYGLTGICGLCAVAEAVLNMSAPMVLPLSKCELKLSPSFVFWLNSTLSFGMAFGGFVVGCLSDILGRKCVIPLTMVVMFIGALGCSFSASKYLLMIFIIVLGIGFGGHSFVARIYLAEVLPQRRRGSQLVILEMFWTIGCLITIGMAWIMIPSALYYSESVFRPNSWRVIAAKGACFGITVACITGLLSPSPRFLLVKQRPIEAIQVLKHMFAINTCSHMDSYQVPDLTGCLQEDPEQNMQGALFTEYTSQTFKRIKRLTTTVFNKRFRQQTFFCIIISLSLFSGVVMTSAWAARLVNWPGMSANETNATDYYFPSVVLPLKPCGDRTTHFYNDVATLYGAVIAANFVLWIIIDVLGHTYCLGIFLISTSACVIALSFKITYIARQILAYILLASYSVSDIAFTIITIEIYPTSIRGTANGIIRVASRIVCGLAKRFLLIPCEIPLLTLGILMLLAAVLSLFLPNLTRKPMAE